VPDRRLNLEQRRVFEAPRPARRRRGPKKLPSFSRLEELYAYTLALVERNNPAALAIEMPPGGWYSRTTAVLLREMFLERGTLDAVTTLIAKGLDHPNAKVLAGRSGSVLWRAKYRPCGITSVPLLGQQGDDESGLRAFPARLAECRVSRG
jgi:hypothetical protein